MVYGLGDEIHDQDVEIKNLKKDLNKITKTVLTSGLEVGEALSNLAKKIREKWKLKSIRTKKS